jgi:hypothetical protein
MCYALSTGGKKYTYFDEYRFLYTVVEPNESNLEEGEDVSQIETMKEGLDAEDIVPFV